MAKARCRTFLPLCLQPCALDQGSRRQPHAQAIHAQESLLAAEQKAETVIAELRRQRLTRAAELSEAHVEEMVSYYAFPDSHGLKLCTNNPFARIMRDFRRRMRVVGAFPDGRSCLNLAAARLGHVAASHWATRRYMNMAPLNASRIEAKRAVA